MKMNKNKLLCDSCGKNCKELVTNNGLESDRYIKWLCEACFKKLYGVSFNNWRLGNE